MVTNTFWFSGLTAMTWTGPAIGGAGATVIVEGVSGIGKTALLRAASAYAAGVGLRVLEAYGGEMEAATPWSVARQLYWSALAADELALRDAPALAGLPFGAG